MRPLLITIVGTRPNFIKVTQFNRVFEEAGFRHELIHTGQHYDLNMAGVFFRQFDLEPDHRLELKHTSPTGQMADILLGLETLFLEHKPAMVLVPGDVNSTLAAALTANKCGIPIGHIESGLRSEDKGMPEEHNRILTDHISELLFVTEKSGLTNLERENIPMDRVHLVGNTMIDTLVGFEERIDASSVLNDHALTPSTYILMTMHRPATVDDRDAMVKLTALIREMTSVGRIIFPIHPRTRKQLQTFGLLDEWEGMDALTLTEPMGYFAFQKLIKHAMVVVTDSGGIQEETTFRQVPCLTLRPNTERPSTLDPGSNTLVPFDIPIISDYLQQIRKGQYKKGAVPPLWDGRASERIASVLRNRLVG
ncbi:MAG: UDP-N-acetylglucosamine 2-epimerase (non-hydrolyzing) [Saprospiraceae bacterium]|nr:UDP-N-acetylglucosamine 2-epimerase (non-hydrolyzing) [Saprospiraceae bacterium]